MNAGINQSMLWITGDLGTNLNTLQSTGINDQGKTIKGSLFYDMISQVMSQKNQISDPLKSTQESQEIFEFETGNTSNSEFAASIDLNSFMSRTLIAFESRSDVLQAIKGNEIMNELENNELTNANSLLSNSNDNLVISDSNVNLANLISNNNPVITNANDNLVITDPNETLVITNANDNPVITNANDNSVITNPNDNSVITNPNGNPVITNPNDNLVIPDSNNNLVNSDVNVNLINSISNDNSVNISLKNNPTFKISNVNPIFSNPEVAKDLPGLQDITSEKTISNSQKEFILEEEIAKGNQYKKEAVISDPLKLNIQTDKLVKETDISSKSVESIHSNYTDQTQGVAINNDMLETQTREIEKLEPYGQIGKEIFSKLEQKGPMEFKMQLEPEDLGKIDIKLKLNEGKLIIDIIASNAKTQALLTSQVDKLVQSMGLQNVLVESVQVNQQTNQQTNQLGQDSQNLAFAMNAGMNFSQKKHQEQMQEQLTRQKNLSNAISPLNDVNQGIEAVRNIGLRNGTRKMDYSV